MSEVAQAKPNNFTHRMRHMSQLLEINGRVDLHIAQRIEILDRDIQLLRKKLRGVRHDRCPTRQEQPLGSRTALLSAVKLHRLIHLNMQPRHELARDLGNRCLMRVFRLFIRAAKAHKTFTDF